MAIRALESVRHSRLSVSLSKREKRVLLRFDYPLTPKTGSGAVESPLSLGRTYRSLPP